MGDNLRWHGGNFVLFKANPCQWYRVAVFNQGDFCFAEDNWPHEETFFGCPNLGEDATIPRDAAKYCIMYQRAPHKQELLDPKCLALRLRDPDLDGAINIALKN